MSALELFLVKVVRETVKELETPENMLKMKNIIWSIGEANLEKDYSEISCDVFSIVWNKLKGELEGFENSTIVAGSPDVSCEIKDNNNNIHKCKIELKSSKMKEMPGSTSGKLDVNQLMIYCSHDKDKNITFRYGQYHQALKKTQFDLFQDRTPRPKIYYNNLSKSDEEIEYKKENLIDWMDHYAECGVNRITRGGLRTKSWQDTMTKRMIEVFIQNHTDEEIQLIREGGFEHFERRKRVKR